MPHAKRAPRRKAPEAAPEETDGRKLRRLRTERRLIDAVGEVLRDQGIASLGVNAVAERAQVEKVLVYRYFGGIDGLMGAYARESDFWPDLDELLGDRAALAKERDKGKVVARVLVRYARALRSRPLTLDLLAWECAHRNALTAALEEVRERRYAELVTGLLAAGVPLDQRTADIGILLGSAVQYLALRGRELRVFAGIPVGEDVGWERIEQALEAAARAVLR